MIVNIVNYVMSSSYISLNTDYNIFYNNNDSIKILDFNKMLDITISMKINNINLGGLLWFVKEIRMYEICQLKECKDFTDMLRMIGIIIGTNTISISDEIYSIKGLTLLELTHIIDNNPDNSFQKLRTYIRKKKLEKIMIDA